MVKIFHFTRIPGCEKKQKNQRWFGNCEEDEYYLKHLFRPYNIILAYDEITYADVDIPATSEFRHGYNTYTDIYANFDLGNYQYLGYPTQLNRYEEFFVIPCNNSDGQHKSNSKECEFILDSHNRVKGISFKIFKESGFILYTSLELHIIAREQLIRWHPLNIFNIKFLYNVIDDVICSELNSLRYFCIFCPNQHGIINIQCYPSYINANCEHNTNLKYGWNIFHICQFHKSPHLTNFYMDSGNELSFYCEPNEKLIPLPSEKPNFKMFILYNNQKPPSLFNLSSSKLFQYNMHTTLEPNKHIIPLSICEKINHLNLKHVYSCFPEKHTLLITKDAHCRTRTKHYSHFIYNW